MDDLDIGKILRGKEYGGLNSSMHYLTKKPVFTLSGTKTVFILDDSAISYINGLDSAGFEKFCSDVASGNTVLISVDGWNAKVDGVDVSYSLFGSSESLEDAATKIIQKCQAGSSLDDIMSNGISDSITLRGETLEVKTVKNSHITETSVKEISENLKSLSLSDSDIEETIYNIVKQNIYRGNLTTSAEFEQAAKVLTEYYDSELTFYSFKNYSDELKNMFNKISDAVAEKGSTMDDVYYAIPNSDKSFSLITYMYSKINGIDSDKIIYFDGSQSDIDLTGKTVVVLDDYAGTGNSLVRQQFKANEYNKKTSLILAPLISKNSAVEYMQGYGKVITNIINAGQSVSDSKLLDKMIQDTGYSSGCIAFPYTIPDNDTDISRALLGKIFKNT